MLDAIFGDSMIGHSGAWIADQSIATTEETREHIVGRYPAWVQSHSRKNDKNR